MQKFNKYTLFIFIILLLLGSASFVFALEAKYPRVPGLPAVTDNSELGDYIGYFFGLGMYLSGILAVISFAVGAIQLIMAASSPEMEKEGKDRMKGSLLGLVLTLSAFIILRTINPSFITPTLTPLPGVEGVFYFNGRDEKPAPISEANTVNVPPGYNQIFYKCSNINSPALLIWKFPQKNFEGYQNAVVVRKTCDSLENISGIGSFKMAFETPGVYYCLGGCSGDMCSGYMSEANLSSGQLPAPFKDNIKSVMVVNDIANDIRYGTIFHDTDDPTRGGFCSLAFFSPDTGKQRACFNGIPVSSSVDIFAWNGKTPETSGDGIEFYSEPFGWNSGAKAGKCFLSQKDNQNNATLCNNLGLISNYWDDDAQKLSFDYTNVDRPPEYKQLYINFRQHPGSIRVKGNYLVILNSLVGQNQYCQTFYKDVPNLNEMEFIAAENNVDIVDVIPIK